jgi:hypothetical protein
VGTQQAENPDLKKERKKEILSHRAAAPSIISFSPPFFSSIKNVLSNNKAIPLWHF